MEYEHFGILLQELRTKYNMSRDKLAQKICTPKQIYRIEKGVSEPSIYILHQLSIKFNLDLNEYYKMHFTSNTLIGLEGINSINSAIEQEDILLIKSMVNKYEKLEDFKKGENLQHIYYSKALCSAILDNDYITSLDYCYKGIKIECPDFDIKTVDHNIYSNIGISLLNCISQNLFAKGKYDDGMKVLSGILTVLEAYVINSSLPLFHTSEFSKKIYQGILYNMSCHLFENGDIINARTYVDKGITHSLKQYNMRHLPALLYMKFKILYSEQNYKEAREYYNHSFMLSKLTNNATTLNDINNLNKTDYPEVFA
jgi:transcriptional regulator with XRE-family HTH domain